MRTQKEIIEALHVLKDVCESMAGDRDCYERCPLGSSSYGCKIQNHPPCDYAINDESIKWKALIE